MEIDKEIENIKERLSVLEDNKNDFKLDKRASENDIITRSYRVHKNAIIEFNNLINTDKFKIYNVQDLVSQAFWEFVNKYKE